MIWKESPLTSIQLHLQSRNETFWNILLHQYSLFPIQRLHGARLKIFWVNFTTINPHHSGGWQAEDGCSQRVNKWPQSKMTPFLFMLLCLTSFSGAVSYTSVTLTLICFPGCYVCHLKCFGFHKWNISIAKATNMPSYVTGNMSEDVENVGRCHIIFP